MMLTLNMMNSERHLIGFRYALAGIRRLVGRERNMRIHCIAASLVIVTGLSVSLTSVEWMIIVLCIGAVMSAEAFNTAIELLADRVSGHYDPAIGHVKDVAAGAVLIVAVAAGIAGLIIFIPKLVLI